MFIFNKAVFLDRDGVLNKLILNPVTKAYESPHRPEDLILYPDITILLNKVRNAGYKLFVVSNQPSYAKGKTSLECLIKIAEKFEKVLISQGVYFDKVFYCFHHPEGVISDYSIQCACRKPKPYYLYHAQQQYSIDLEASWMIGDRDSDIECGQRAGCRTILIKNPHSVEYHGKSSPSFSVNNLSEAVDLILNIKVL